MEFTFFAQLREQIDAAGAAISSATTLTDLDQIEKQFLGKTSTWKKCSESVKTLNVADRPQAGKEIGAFRTALIDALETTRTAQRAEVAANAPTVDLTLPPTGRARGTSHLITQVRRQLEDIFIGLGYTIAEGPEVEDDWHNFEALNFPPGHPARDMQDTLYTDRGNGKEVLLRTQTSTVQVRTMESQKPPIYVVAPGRVFRQETLDARHSPVFHQIEGLAVDTDLSLSDMFGTIHAFLSAYFDREVETRFQPSFFPFTEPSCEFAARCVFCNGDGCRVCSKTGWIELGGCGMVDPNVFVAVGYDPNAVTGFAFGFGLERMAMLRHSVDNISAFYTNDVRFLRQF